MGPTGKQKYDNVNNSIRRAETCFPKCYEHRETAAQSMSYHNMEPFFALLVLYENHPQPADSPHKGPTKRSFGDTFVVGLNKLLNKQSSRRLL